MWRVEIGKRLCNTPSKTLDKEKVRQDELKTLQIKLQTNEGERNYLRERIAKAGGISTVLVGGILHPNKKRSSKSR
jgi:hypothetical protein